MIRAVIASLFWLLWLATATVAQPVTDRERGLFVIGTYERIRNAASDTDLHSIALDIRDSGYLLDYESVDWLFDKIAEQRHWLDPVNDDVYWERYQSLGDLIAHRFRDAAPGVPIERAMDAQWAFYQGILDWQSENPGFSRMDRWHYGSVLWREIAESSAFIPDCNSSGGLAFDAEGRLLMPCDADQ